MSMSVSIAGNKVTINGKVFIVPSGKPIKVINEKIYVDGQIWSKEEDSKYLTPPLEIEWEGDVAALKVTGNVTCGNVKRDVDASGDVECKDVQGNVNASGDVNAGAIGGSVNASGDVSCGKVSGNIMASGDVYTR